MSRRFSRLSRDSRICNLEPEPRAKVVDGTELVDGRVVAPLAKTHLQECPECDGMGSTRDWDDDRYVTVKCEACRGVGSLTDCRECFEVISIPEAEDGSGVCPSCRIAHETKDQRDEMDRIRRIG